MRHRDNQLARPRTLNTRLIATSLLSIASAIMTKKHSSLDRTHPDETGKRTCGHLGVRLFAGAAREPPHQNMVGAK